jgi:hypothetical protein
MILDQLPPNSKTYLHARGERLSHSSPRNLQSPVKKAIYQAIPAFNQKIRKILKDKLKLNMQKKLSSILCLKQMIFQI